MSIILLFLTCAAYAAHVAGDAVLGVASEFAVLAGSGVTNTGQSTVNGHIGSHPTQTITGLSGITFLDGAAWQAGNNLTQTAKDDLVDAYNHIASITPTTAVGPELGGLTLLPGNYSGGALAITGTLTLDGNGDSDAIFTFKAASSLIPEASSVVALVNGTRACNVHWQVTSSATLKSGANFAGNILALESITLVTGATIDGRALARNAAVTMDNNTILLEECPQTPAPTPSPTPEPTGMPTVSPTASPTSSPTQSSTDSPTPSPTPEPTSVAPTPEPTASPTPLPTPEPTSVAPTPEPTALAVTPEPTPEPTLNVMEACVEDEEQPSECVEIYRGECFPLSPEFDVNFSSFEIVDALCPDVQGKCDCACAVDCELLGCRNDLAQKCADYGPCHNASNMPITATATQPGRCANTPHHVHQECWSARDCTCSCVRGHGLQKCGAVEDACFPRNVGGPCETLYGGVCAAAETATGCTETQVGFDHICQDVFHPESCNCECCIECHHLRCPLFESEESSDSSEGCRSFGVCNSTTYRCELASEQSCYSDEECACSCQNPHSGLLTKCDLPAYL